ncbi:MULTISPECIES: DeoR/GlpR family DNA-binding transcription regulator [Paenibacillus]|uniref:DeoR/GlpR family DNA-binding transcription regulator n=1 Tax=Paenibacillus TaxID=44249 RepID=UPI0013FD9717|nr:MULTISPECIES: DeoR/GlpR family DNA-binding transcription regulator [Paenibacillus]MEC0255869.1 DeoR/GlpR family DNA-binding transcription regulator [Paenibacillus lautus]
MFAEERRQKILALLHQDKRVIAKDLAERFEISIDSIRRDLTIMEEQGLLQKTHGGAIPSMKVRQPPPVPEQRYGEGSPEGNAIAQLAVSYVREKDTLFIGSSSLTYLLLKHLPEQTPLTIVTNCMRVAEALREREWIDTYLIGGRVKPSGNITDVLANEFIRQFKFDISFVSGGGISDEGIFVATPEVAAFGRAVSAVSRRRIGMATHRILGQDGFARAGSVEDLDVLITDQKADQEVMDRIQELGVKVIVAKTEEVAQK